MLYALSAGGFFYLAWNLWTFIGVITGQLLPDLTQFGLDSAIAAIFIALVIPSIKNLATLFACLASGIYP